MSSCFSGEVLVVGAGKRVRRDILPVLRGLGIRSSQTVILRQRREQVDGFEEISVITSLKELSGYGKELVVLVSVPGSAVNAVTSQVVQSLTPCLILFDTPVLRNVQGIVNAVGSICPLASLEDAALVPWLVPLRRRVTVRARHLIFFRSVIGYHGAALIRQLTASRDITSIFSRPGRPTVHRLRSGVTTIDVVGYRNYETGKILIRRSSDSWRILGDQPWMGIKGLALPEVLSPEELSEIGVIGSRLGVDHHAMLRNPVRHMLGWKRFGLFVGLGEALSSRRILFPSLEDAASNEVLIPL